MYVKANIIMIECGRVLQKQISQWTMNIALLQDGSSIKKFKEYILVILIVSRLNAQTNCFSYF